MRSLIIHPNRISPIWVHISQSYPIVTEGSLEVKLPTMWTDEKQSGEEEERGERLEETRVEEKE